MGLFSSPFWPLQVVLPLLPKSDPTFLSSKSGANTFFGSCSSCLQIYPASYYCWALFVSLFGDFRHSSPLGSFEKRAVIRVLSETGQVFFSSCVTSGSHYFFLEINGGISLHAIACKDFDCTMHQIRDVLTLSSCVQR